MLDQKIHGMFSISRFTRELSIWVEVVYKREAGYVTLHGRGFRNLVRNLEVARLLEA